LSKTELEFPQNLYGKDIIAYGTGKVGKIMIPYLAQNPNIRLHGVTNSRVTTADAGTFLDTGLPIRSVGTWAKLIPNATILILILDTDLYFDLLDICQDAGFGDVIFIEWNSVNAVADINRNLYATQQLSSLVSDYSWFSLTGNPFLKLVGLANEIKDTHTESFREYKACNKNKTVSIIATGPTLNFYSQIGGVPHIGINTSFRKKDIKLDFYFLYHYVPQWLNDLKSFSFVKFFAYNGATDWDDVIPEHIVEEHKARRFFQDAHSKEIYTNIEYYPLMGFDSVVFQAIHFAIYTRPKRILLVGCDCSTDGHFDELTPDFTTPRLLSGHKRVRAFVERHYPDTEIISINPVGLKGLYRDAYTESYLDAHPEIDRSTVEILNPADYEEK